MARGPERTAKRSDVLRVMREERTDPREPWTASEIADHLPIERRVAHDRLGELYELDKVRTKKVGARARVWWLADGVEES